MKKEFVLTHFEESVFHITLNRAEKGNCYNSQMILEIINAFQEVRHHPAAKLIFLKSNGPHFCTGADLDWMKEGSALTNEENFREMEKIKLMYQEIIHSELPIIGKFHGSISGGGVGLALVCDISACDQNTQFSLPESNVGLIPGIISPIIIDKIGKAAFIEMSLTGKKVNYAEALQKGMVTFSGSTSEVDLYLEQTIAAIKQKSSEAVKTIITSTRNLSDDLKNEMEKYLILSAKMRHSSDFYEYCKK